MDELVLVGLAGFLAAMVDGALGMGFGPTSASILLSVGISPAAASASINLAKVATGVAGGVAHSRAGNTDRRLVLRLAVPGAVGAAIGATVLANVDGDSLRPFLAVLLLAVGLRILVRFAIMVPSEADEQVPGDAGFSAPGVEVAAVAGGVTNGMIGAWGPVVTPFLLHRRIPPRYAVGCVNTAEIAVAVVSAGTLLAASGGEGIRAGIVIAMLVGGVAAAPIAAVVIRHIPPRALGIAVAALLLGTQSREIANTVDLPGSRWLAYSAVVVGVAVAGLFPRLRSLLAGGAPVAGTEPVGRLRLGGDRLDDAVDPLPHDDQGEGQPV
ncbi:MAG: permease [Acidimicrobiales bacterium]|nr:permease [Acidimicrobiales bacterium]